MEVLSEALHEFGYGCIVLQIYLFVFYRAPQTLDEDVVRGPGACKGGSGQCWATNLSGDYNTSECACIQTPEMDLSSCLPGDTVELALDHWYDFKSGYDGATVQAFNGTSWVDIDPTDGYPGNINASGCTFDNKDGYTSYGTTETWRSETFYVSGFSNSDFRIRFCMASDSGTNASGWYVDNVTVEGVE